LRDCLKTSELRIFLPLLHRMEERAGERRRFRSKFPLSSILSPFVPYGERKKNSVLRQPHSVRAAGELERNGAHGVTSPYLLNPFRYSLICPHNTARFAPVVCGRFPGCFVIRKNASNANAAGSMDCTGQPNSSLVQT